MQTRFADRNEKYLFNSLHEMSEFINNSPHVWRARSSQKWWGGMSWDLNAGYDGAVKMATNGWIEGAECAQDALKAFAPMSAAPDTKIDFYGFRPHVARFCAGVPDSMIRHTRNADSGSGRVLTLAVPINAMARTNAKHMSNFGVGVAQYINQMETSGTRIELIAMAVNNINGHRVTFAVNIKHADQPLDLAVLSFAIGHPAMFRRLFFALLERCRAPESPGYGQSIDAKAGDIINAPLGTIVLNGMQKASKHAKTPEAAFEYISQQIDKAIEEQHNDD